MGKYILCIDNGLTTTKSVLFTLDGFEIASSITNTTVESKGPFAEIDMETQWNNTIKVIKDTITKSGIDPTNIVGVGNSGHGAGLYCIDDRNKPVRKAISSMDERAIGILNNWQNEGRTSYSIIRQNLWCGQPIPLLYWIKKNEKDNYNRIRSFFMVKDWIIFKLTGEIGIEYTDASNSGLVNPISKQIDERLFKLFDINEMVERVPQLRKSTDIAGYVTKKASEETLIKEGTPVIGGVFDVVSCAIGSGVYKDDKYSIIAGTWNINTGIEDKLLPGSDTMKHSFYADTSRYAYVESSATSAVNLQWFIDNIIKGFGNKYMPNEKLYTIIDKGIRKIKIDESNVLYMPFLYKSHLAKNMGGSFLGIRPEDNIFHLVYAIFEGVVFAHYKHIMNLMKAGITRNGAVLSGGASNSEFWCQMFADVLNMEITITEASQVGALGVALCTAVAMKLYSNFEVAIDSMVRKKRHYYPNSDRHRLYMNKYAEFNEMIHRID